MFEDHMHRILLNWKSARRRNTNKKKTKVKRKRKQKRKPNLSNGTGKHFIIASCKRDAIKYKLFYVQDLPNQNLLLVMKTM